MTKSNSEPMVAPFQAESIDRLETDFPVQLGQWVYVLSSGHTPDPSDPQDCPADHWFGCVMHIGTNYIEVRSLTVGRSGYRSTRIHYRDLYSHIRPVTDPKLIRQNVEHWQGRVRHTLAEVQALTARLGVDDTQRLGQGTSAGTGTDLAVVSGQRDVEAYNSALVHAKETELPALFKRLERENAAVACWLGAEALPLIAQSGDQDALLKKISGRVFYVELYAGLEEQVETVRDGEPAPYDTKLRVMQARKYMDEECLLNYTLGGMEFPDIGEFDAWLAHDENLKRLMPFPRCLVAFRVRREDKQRHANTLTQRLINLRLEQADKLTFLYFRNGEQVYRLSTTLDFGETIFPDANEFDPTEAYMVRVSIGRVKKRITRREFDERVAEREILEEKREQWFVDHPYESWAEEQRAKNPHAPNDRSYWEVMANPYERSYNHHFNPSEWEPFDDSSVYFDDILAQEKDRLDHFNRIALIIQGLYDRSEVFAPHGKLESWKPESFAQHIELVYDGSRVLHDGETPDIEAYIAQCNASITTDSVLIGQERAWGLREAQRENDRRDRDYRLSNAGHVEYFEPFGDPGPGYVAQPTKVQPRAQTASFGWYRESVTEFDKSVRATITVPFDRLFNVSAYRPGDFLPFFQDPRTRAAYLKWAPMMLAAEEYHAGNPEFQPQAPVHTPAEAKRRRSVPSR